MPAPALSRQQRRKIRRDLAHRGRRALQRGLPTPLSDEDGLAIALCLRETLSDPAKPQRAAAMAEEAETILDRTLAAQTKPLNIACAKGCNHCCHCLVVATPPEIFRIANWLSRRSEDEVGSLVTKVHSEATRRRPMSAQDRFQDSALCAMDVSGACGVYTVRPLPCRALLSLSAEACRLGIMEGRGQIPLVTAAMDTAEIVRTLMLAAVRSLGLSDAGYELTAGVSLVLTTPDAERRWLAGEDVFAGAPRGPRPPQARALEDRIAMQIQSLVD